MLYVVASGRMAADISDALTSPTAKRMAANCPAKGASALAASATSVISRWLRMEDRRGAGDHDEERDHVGDDAAEDHVDSG